MRNHLIICFLVVLLSPTLLIAQLPFGTFDEEFTTLYIAVDDGMEGAFRKETISEDIDGNIWITTNNGVLRYDGYQCINFSTFLKKSFPEKYKVDHERTILADTLGQIWMGGAKGLSVYNIFDGSYNRITLSEPMYKEDFRNTVRSLLVFSGQLYVGTENGMFIVDMALHEVINSYKTDGTVHEGRNHTDFTFQAVYPDICDSLIYLQLNDGMHIINTKSNTEKLITTCELAYNEPYGQNEHWFHQGVVTGDYIIAGSWNTGITHFNMIDEEYEIFLPEKKRHTNPNPNIFKDTKALNDSVIILTGQAFGLFTYEFPKRKLTRMIGAPTAMHHKGMIDSYGHYWVGGPNGLYRSNRKLAAATNNNRSLQLGEAFTENSSLGYISLQNIENIDLEEHQDDLTIYVTLTQAYELKDIRYQYKIDSKEWIDIDNNVLEINKITSGNHRLQIRVKNADIEYNTILTINRHIPWYKRWYYILLFILLISGILYLLYRWRLKQELEKERIKNSYELKITKLNNSALRYRMNPHFLFNTLNAIKHHALFKEKEDTGEYITDFSQLIRGILEYSDEDYINLKNDIAWIKNYINIENRRFRKPFAFSFSIDPTLDLDKYQIPPLLIQPYVENAIWHGLQYKADDRLLTLKYNRIKNGFAIEILDNGIGRNLARKLASKNTRKSLGLKITKERIDNINSQNQYEINIKTIDLTDDQNIGIGTSVIVQITKKGE